MCRLKNSPLISYICRWRETHATHQACGKIRENVAEHILGHYHVKFPRPTNEVQCARIDIDVLDIDVVEHAPAEKPWCRDVGRGPVVAASRFVKRGERGREGGGRREGWSGGVGR